MDKVGYGARLDQGSGGRTPRQHLQCRRQSRNGFLSFCQTDILRPLHPRNDGDARLRRLNISLGSLNACSQRSRLPPGALGVHSRSLRLACKCRTALLRGLRLALGGDRSEEHTSELQSLMRTSYAVFCLKKKTTYATLCHNLSTPPDNAI